MLVKKLKLFTLIGIVFFMFSCTKESVSNETEEPLNLVETIQDTGTLTKSKPRIKMWVSGGDVLTSREKNIYGTGQSGNYYVKTGATLNISSSHFGPKKIIIKDYNTKQVIRTDRLRANGSIYYLPGTGLPNNINVFVRNP